MHRMTQKQLNEQLHDAVQADDIEDVKKAIKAGADVNATDKYGNTPLYWADWYGDIEQAELLKQHGGV